MRAKASEKKQQPATEQQQQQQSATSRHIGIGIVIGALFVLVSFYFFETTQLKSNFIGRVQNNYQHVRGGGRVEQGAATSHTTAADSTTNLADAKAQIKAAEQLERQMTLVNTKLEQQHEKERTRLVKELTTVTEQLEKEQLQRLQCVQQLQSTNSAVQPHATSTTPTTPTTPTTNSKEYKELQNSTNPHRETTFSQTLEEMLLSHKQLQADMVSGKQPMRAITFGANGKSDVGGYGNRMIGMLTGMLLALYLDRAYYIDHSTGFHMSDYYEGGNNHNIPWSHLLQTAAADVSVVDFQGQAGRVRCVTLFEKMSKAMDEEHIGFQTNQDCFLDIHMHYQALKPGLLSRRDTLTTLYNYLFKPTPMFATVLSALQPHIRTEAEFLSNSGTSSTFEKLNKKYFSHTFFFLMLLL